MVKAKVSCRTLVRRRVAPGLWLSMALVLMVVGVMAAPVGAVADIAGPSGGDLDQISDLAAILAVALERSPSLGMAALEVAEAQAGQDQIQATLKPQLSVMGQQKMESAVSQLANENMRFALATGQMKPGEGFSSTTGSVTWYQQLGVNPQLRALLEQAEIGGHMATLGQHKALAEVALASQGGYHRVLQAVEGLMLAQDAEEHGRLNVVAEEAKLHLGTATPLDLLKEKNAYLEAQMAAEGAATGVEMAVLALLQTMGQELVDSEQALAWAGQLAQSYEPATEPWQVELAPAFEFLTRHRPELILVREQVALAKTALDQVRGERDWQVKLAGQYAPSTQTFLQSSVDSDGAWTTTVMGTRTQDLPEDPAGGGGGIDTKPWQVELSASYRFGDGGAKQARIAAKEAAWQKAKLQLEAAEAGFYLELYGAVQELNQLWRGYLLALEGGRMARDTLAQLELMYEYGSLTEKEVREGRLLVAQADHKVLTAGLNYEGQKAKVAVLMGVPGPVLVKAMTGGSWQNAVGSWGADDN